MPGRAQPLGLFSDSESFHFSSPLEALGPGVWVREAGFRSSTCHPSSLPSLSPPPRSAVATTEGISGPCRGAVEQGSPPPGLLLGCSKLCVEGKTQCRSGLQGGDTAEPGIPRLPVGSSLVDDLGFPQGQLKVKFKQLSGDIAPPGWWYFGERM